MDNQVFREKSIKQFSTPDQLTDYLRVTGPGLWFVLGGIIVLLIGGLCWGIFGRIISTVEVPAQIKDGEILCYILQEDFNQKVDQVAVTIGDVKMDIKTDDVQIKYLDASEDDKLYLSGYLSPGKSVAVLRSKTDLKDGIYEAKVETEAFKPVSLMFSNE